MGSASCPKQCKLTGQGGVWGSFGLSSGHGIGRWDNYLAAGVAYLTTVPKAPNCSCYMWGFSGLI
jgi:hypothetical protein